MALRLGGLRTIRLLCESQVQDGARKERAPEMRRDAKGALQGNGESEERSLGLEASLRQAQDKPFDSLRVNPSLYHSGQAGRREDDARRIGVPREGKSWRRKVASTKATAKGRPRRCRTKGAALQGNGEMPEDEQPEGDHSRDCTNSRRLQLSGGGGETGEVCTGSDQWALRNCQRPSRFSAVPVKKPSSSTRLPAVLTRTSW